jgi:3-oxoadipate enol-lactonase
VAKAAVNGVSLAYELSGAGEETLVFLNGIAMSIPHWAPVVTGLGGRFRCLCHDFRGQLQSLRARGGESGTAGGAPLAPIRLSDHVDDLTALMETLGIRRAHIMGTSYGAEVGMLFACAHPAMTASLTVIDGASELDPLLRAAALAWRAAALADPVVFYRTIIPWNYSAAYIGASAAVLAQREKVVAGLPRAYFEDFASLCDAFLELSITPHLGRISCPALVLVGEKDILKHEGFARIIAGGIRGARLRVIPGAGHAAVVETPSTVLSEVGEFLDGLRGPGGG